MRHSTPHPLDLYRLAVQHPEAEVQFLLKAYRHYARTRGGKNAQDATRLREDFAGTAAVASAFVGLHENHRALAVERDKPTLDWATQYALQELGDRAADLHLLWADVMDIRRPYVPGVDVVAALNFSTFIYHTPAALRDYFFAARHALLRGGILVIDAYGGPGALRISQQKRTASLDGCHWPDGSHLGAKQPTSVLLRSQHGSPPSRWIGTLAARGTPPRSFEYIWDQRSYDAVTNRVDCRIHFRLPGGRMIRDAFRYDWRLWSLPEIVDLMRQAGFTDAQVWCDRYDPAPGAGTTGERSDGIYRPVSSLPAREDWVAYVVGVK